MTIVTMTQEGSCVAASPGQERIELFINCLNTNIPQELSFWEHSRLMLVHSVIREIDRIYLIVMFSYLWYHITFYHL